MRGAQKPLPTQGQPHRDVTAKQLAGYTAARLDKVERSYLQLQMQMRGQFLEHLLNIDRLCVRLNVLQRGDEQLEKLQKMHSHHIRPLIARLQAPTNEVVRSELQWLVKMSKLLPPFLREFGDSMQDIRRRAQRDLRHLVEDRVTAAAA